MTDTEYMQIALDEAQKAYNEGEIPIGAVLVYKDIILAASGKRHWKHARRSRHVRRQFSRS